MRGDPLTITQHDEGGRLRQVSIDGQAYSVSHLYCDCADARILEGQHQDAYIDVMIDCPQHGRLETVATPCSSFEAVRPSLAFAWIEQRHEKDRRVAWGMAHHTITKEDTP